jgi:hypothetical protein
MGGCKQLLRAGVHHAFARKPSARGRMQIKWNSLERHVHSHAVLTGPVLEDSLIDLNFIAGERAFALGASIRRFVINLKLLESSVDV